MAGKGEFDSEGAQPASQSKAARFNAHVLKKLQAAVIKDPEINLAEQFPLEYPQRLTEMRNPIESSPKKTKYNPPEADEDIRRSLCPSDPVEIVFPLSDAVAKLIEPVSQTAEGLPVGLSQRLFEVLKSSEILWKAPFARQKVIFKCSAEIVVKAIRNMECFTKYTALQYLDRYKSNIPVPKPLDLDVRRLGQSGIHSTLIENTPLAANSIRYWQICEPFLLQKGVL
ncbi:hypothetical protein N7537_009735 [Penicillium hordei]|uniref:Uncharacterized protein n=1 Tax=Penicillium hordei TaxID=40994 RepID=A0AAD6GV19_9EURO|nr:uncharacterized protein N7537_009735 [Penicillium hordei]KAJ5592831.1 hypothetical protein N7537_009735 [Penicillium hordei]